MEIETYQTTPEKTAMEHISLPIVEIECTL